MTVIDPRQPSQVVTSEVVTGEDIKDTISNNTGLSHIAPWQTVTFSGTVTFPVTSNIPYSTQHYRKRKLNMEKEGILKRKYERKKEPVS
ncbi:hypothetical protein DPMN_116080 [Dreissena polymorpha]|uniref:Uncharacterized protein n=1 Tax=Dreissena polymorpha TaxID=45954 RepID=A0A9D4QTZ6_DREPO|nr:hypothetical protein DPMN_116080 [Dreissena polymorpha]